MSPQIKTNKALPLETNPAAAASGLLPFFLVKGKGERRMQAPTSLPAEDLLARLNELQGAGHSFFDKV